MDNSSRQKAILDKIAVGLSGLCLLHCLLLPFVVAVLPFLGQFGNDHFHAELLLFVVPVSVIALGVGYRRHHRAVVLVFGATGLIILAIGGTYVHDTYGEMPDRAMTVTGSIILAFTHFKNFRLARKDLQLISQ
ncbi:MAG: MerC domain-containing protein [Woeseiaceae bacterium]